MNYRLWNEETIKKWRLGFFPENYNELIKFCNNKSISNKDLEEQCIIKYNNSFFYNRVIFPVFDSKNDIISITGRVLNDNKPKYFNTVFDKGKNLYGINYAKESIRKNDLVYLFEGNADVITAHQYEIKNSVCFMGTAITIDQLILLSRYTKNIIIMLDKDEAGFKALKAFNKRMENYKNIIKEMNIKRVFLDKTKDTDEFLKLYGKNEFVSYIETFLKDKDKQYRLSSVA
jgi:DNA primase